MRKQLLEEIHREAPFNEELQQKIIVGKSTKYKTKKVWLYTGSALALFAALFFIILKPSVETISTSSHVGEIHAITYGEQHFINEKLNEDVKSLWKDLNWKSNDIEELNGDSALILEMQLKNNKGFGKYPYQFIIKNNEIINIYSFNENAALTKSQAAKMKEILDYVSIEPSPNFIKGIIKYNDINYVRFFGQESSTLQNEDLQLLQQILQQIKWTETSNIKNNPDFTLIIGSSINETFSSEEMLMVQRKKDQYIIQSPYGIEGTIPSKYVESFKIILQKIYVGNWPIYTDLNEEQWQFWQPYFDLSVKGSSFNLINTEPNYMIQHNGRIVSIYLNEEDFTLVDAATPFYPVTIDQNILRQRLLQFSNEQFIDFLSKQTFEVGQLSIAYPPNQQWITNGIVYFYWEATDTNQAVLMYENQSLQYYTYLFSEDERVLQQYLYSINKKSDN